MAGQGLTGAEDFTKEGPVFSFLAPKGDDGLVRIGLRSSKVALFRGGANGGAVGGEATCRRGCHCPFESSYTTPVLLQRKEQQSLGRSYRIFRPPRTRIRMHASASYRRTGSTSVQNQLSIRVRSDSELLLAEYLTARAAVTM